MKPDFSQVESDASLVTVNERFALFFAEKRPFFLEGIELFNTPNQLVYTPADRDAGCGREGDRQARPDQRRVPLGARRHAVSDESSADGVATSSRTAIKALFNVARLRRDFGGNSTIALTVTDRRAGDTTEHGDRERPALRVRPHVLLRDAVRRFVHEGFAATRHDRSARTSPVWKAELDRTGRSLGLQLSLQRPRHGFHQPLGLRPRTGIITLHGFNRFSYYGKPGARLENITMFFGPTPDLAVRQLRAGRRVRGAGVDLRTMFRLRGGWNGSLNASRNFFTFDSGAYSGLYIAGPDGLQPYLPPDDSGHGAHERIANGHDADVPEVQRDDDGRAERGGDLRRGVDGAGAASDGGPNDCGQRRACAARRR